MTKIIIKFVIKGQNSSLKSELIPAWVQWPCPTFPANKHSRNQIHHNRNNQIKSSRRELPASVPCPLLLAQKRTPPTKITTIMAKITIFINTRKSESPQSTEEIIVKKRTRSTSGFGGLALPFKITIIIIKISLTIIKITIIIFKITIIINVMIVNERPRSTSGFPMTLLFPPAKRKAQKPKITKIIKKITMSIIIITLTTPTAPPPKQNPHTY